MNQSNVATSKFQTAKQMSNENMEFLTASSLRVPGQWSLVRVSFRLAGVILIGLSSVKPLKPQPYGIYRHANLDCDPPLRGLFMARMRAWSDSLALWRKAMCRGRISTDVCNSFTSKDRSRVGKFIAVSSIIPQQHHYIRIAAASQYRRSG